MIPASFRRHSLRALLVLAGLCSLSCRNLEKFDTKPGSAFCGAVGLQDFQEGFIPANRMPNLELQLTLDTSKLDGQPGTLRSSDSANGICPGQALFQEAPVRAIPEVDRDAISALSFGEGHLHDFFVWVDSSCQGTMLGVISLVKNNQVELRLFKPARLPSASAQPGERPGFAVFHMAMENSGDPARPCGF